jgi:hypothetical protein
MMQMHYNSESSNEIERELQWSNISINFTYTSLTVILYKPIEAVRQARA